MYRSYETSLDLGRFAVRLLARMLLGLALLTVFLGALDYSDTGTLRTTQRTEPVRAL